MRSHLNYLVRDPRIVVYVKPEQSKVPNASILFPTLFRIGYYPSELSSRLARCILPEKHSNGPAGLLSSKSTERCTHQSASNQFQRSHPASMEFQICDTWRHESALVSLLPEA